MRYLLIEVPDVLHLDPAAEFEFEDGGLVAEGVSAVRQLLCLLADETACDDVTDRVRPQRRVSHRKGPTIRLWI
jgi:hypothetical protein